MYKRRARILFLGTSDASRSRMAEGWANHLGGEWLEARSAVIGVHGEDPRAIAVMREAGVDIARHASTRVTPAVLEWADLVVTFCGHAATRRPALPPHVQVRHLFIVDPASGSGTEDKIMARFKAVRDQIRAEVESMVGGLRMMARSGTQR